MSSSIPSNREGRAGGSSLVPNRRTQSVDGISRTNSSPRDEQDVHDVSATNSVTRHTESSTQETPIAATIQVLIAEKERIRALRRERQIRYRKKKHDYMLSLEDETKTLREEIKNLQQQRKSLCAILPTNSNVWSVVVEYFRLFQHGFHVNAQVSVPSVPSWSDAQLDFIRTTISPNVSFNSEQGVEALIRSWQDLSQWFEDVHVELEELDKSVDGSVIAATRTSVTITEHTLRYVFPHLCGSSNARQARYGRQLVGQRIIMPGLTRFKLDASTQRVSTLTAQSDMLTPMLEVLGSLEDVSNVFELSRISLDFQWRPVDGLLSLKRKREVSMNFSSSMTPSSVSHAGNETHTPRTDTESVKSENQYGDVVAEEIYQRELRRARQIRYRKKQDDHMKSVEVGNELLREEIKTLERRKRCVSTIYPVQENIWNVALEYFRVFRNGLQTRAQTSSGNQFEFLRAAMTSDAIFNTGRGSEAMIRSWKCISLWFQDVELELEEMKKGPWGSLVATTTMRITITERTVRNVFPHLCRTSENNDGLADILLGQRIVMRGFTHFEWDAAQRRVSSVIAESDLLTPMLHLVGSVEKVSRVFDKSIISAAFQWRLTAN
ncbi:Hypothetical protein PHPALM_14969 [Phytophthora palmivora]|uniref:Bzip transcription factor n=1 Tax=Phytophthora palmivora TaxID=4796 RepID=A0A2P4XTL1_9STRA|nr:Hypothetical protein PHPALM_14969 [Phytophthora palmivora]